MAKMITLVDPFNLTSLNTGLWTQFTAGGATMSYTAGGASTVYPASTTSSTDGDLTSNVTYDLTGSQVCLEVLQIANTGSPTTVDNFFEVHDAGGSNKLTFLVEAGSIYAQQLVAGVQTNLTSAVYNSTTHKWLRFREAAGTTYWEISSNGTSWTTFWSAADPITETALVVQIDGTAYSTATSPGSYTWANLNNPPTTVNKGAAFLAAVNS